MRILVISNLFPPAVFGGYEILCQQVCDELSRRGHDIEVLTSDHGTDGDTPYPISRILRLYEPMELPARLSRRKRQRTARENRRATREFLADREFDLAFVWSQLRLTWGAARGAQDAGLRCVYTFNDPHPASYVPAPLRCHPLGIYRYVADRLLFPGISIRDMRLGHTTCISQCLKDQLLERGLPVPGSRVIYQGIPVDRFPCKAEPGRISSPARLLYAGQLHAYKGVHTLIRALGEQTLRDTGLDIELHIAGDGPHEYRHRLESLAADSPRPVRFLGKVAHADMPALYREHDALVFPSEWPEPFGLTHLEAMASGTPVISTSEGGHGEFLVDGHNALLFDKGDSGQLAERIRRLLSDHGLARGLAEEARRLAATEFSLTRYVGDLEALLRETAASPVR